MAWAVWLAVPLVLTVAAALVTWWRGRPPRSLSTGEAVRAHERFLDALGSATRGGDECAAGGDDGSATPGHDERDAA